MCTFLSAFKMEFIQNILKIQTLSLCISIYISLRSKSVFFAFFPFFGQLARFRKSCFSTLAKYKNQLKFFCDDCVKGLKQKISRLTCFLWNLRAYLTRRKARELSTWGFPKLWFWLFLFRPERTLKNVFTGNNAYKLAKFNDWVQQGYLFVSSNFPQSTRSTLKF